MATVLELENPKLRVRDLPAAWTSTTASSTP